MPQCSYINLERLTDCLKKDTWNSFWINSTQTEIFHILLLLFKVQKEKNLQKSAVVTLQIHVFLSLKVIHHAFKKYLCHIVYVPKTFFKRFEAKLPLLNREPLIFEWLSEHFQLQYHLWPEQAHKQAHNSSRCEVLCACRSAVFLVKGDTPWKLSSGQRW